MDPSHQQLQWMQAHHNQQGWAAGPTTSAAAVTTTISSSYHQPTSIDDIRTLWIGDLQYWVDESYLHSCFAHTGEVLSIKIIRNKITGLPEGYGFVEFVSHAAAERVLQTYNGLPMPGIEQSFRLNWASFGIGERRGEGTDLSIFVGDLAPDVTDYLLQETFRAQYPSVRGAKVVTDPNTGRSKGYGFVKFADEMERNRAMTEMNGVYCSTRPMRISAATPKKTTVVQQTYATAKAVYPTPATYVTSQLPPVLPDGDITNTTIFVGGLDPNSTEEELRQIFSQFGELIYVKIPAGKGCGFVQFAARASAEDAIQRVHGTMIGQQIVRLSWGRSPASKQDPSGAWIPQADATQWESSYYSYGYDAYAYGAPQDPSLYAYGTYAGYGQYPQQVEGVSDMTYMAGAPPTIEHSEETDNSLAIPSADKLSSFLLHLSYFYSCFFNSSTCTHERFQVKCFLPCRSWKCNTGTDLVVEKLATNSKCLSFLAKALYIIELGTVVHCQTCGLYPIFTNSVLNDKNCNGDDFEYFIVYFSTPIEPNLIGNIFECILVLARDISLLHYVEERMIYLYSICYALVGK